MITPFTLCCEIHAPSQRKGEELAYIVESCAQELAHPVTVKQRRIPRNQRGSIPSHISLELPVNVAASQHDAWCLARHLACYCPDVRVSVRVKGADTFDSSSADFAFSAPAALWA